MHRYIAFAWNQQNAEAASFARTLAGRLPVTLPKWQCVLNTENLEVYQAGGMATASKAYMLERNEGVVLGKVFKRDLDLYGGMQDVEFSESEARKVQESKGRHLVDQYWGRYVTLLRDKDGKHVRVLRDPSGAMPCLLTEFRNIYVICSHLDDAAALGLVDCAINWAHIVGYLWANTMSTSDTGLRGVRQIQAGECLTINTSGNVGEATFYWTPGRIHDVRTVEDRQQAMSELRDTVRYCVGAWASGYHTILHRLSGGIDSAVVLACLSRAPNAPKVICENNFTNSAEGDERLFAREAADHAGVELIETRLRSSDQTIASMFDPRKVATPRHTTLLQEAHSITESIVKERGVGAVFSGQGGDHFFQATKTPHIAAEYAWRNGLRPELLRVIADTSRLTRRSIWSVLATVLGSTIFHRFEDPYDQLKVPPLLGNATRDATGPARLRHPWIDKSKHLPGSKLLQIFHIIDTQHFFYAPPDYADIVHPLISQPIIELCLQIPCYILTYNGIDRALVREAFSRMVPPEITGRTIKGGTTSHANDLLLRNIPFLRGYLLDGILVREGVLDRGKTEAGLTESHLIRDPFMLFPVLNAVRAEAWLRTWVSDGRRAAA